MKQGIEKLRTFCRRLAKEEDFDLVPWERVNPFWRFSILVGAVSVGWGLHALLSSKDSAGLTPLILGTATLIGGSALFEYLFCEPHHDSDTTQDREGPSSGLSGDEGGD